MRLDGNAGATLRRLGRHQGALIPVPTNSRLATLLPPGTGHAVVASQDCDIVAPSSVESAVDLLPAVIGTDPESDLFYGRNPRRLWSAGQSNRQIATETGADRGTVGRYVAVVEENGLKQGHEFSEAADFGRWRTPRSAHRGHLDRPSRTGPGP